MGIFSFFRRKNKIDKNNDFKPNEKDAVINDNISETTGDSPINLESAENTNITDIITDETTDDINNLDIAEAQQTDVIESVESDLNSDSDLNPPELQEEIDAEQQESIQSSQDVTINKNYTGKFEINKTKDGKKFFFNLYASNKVGIATSQMYSTAQNALNGVKSVIANAPKAPIEDQSLKKYETLPYPKWEIYIDNGGKFRFRLNASNGSCVCHSQGYTTKTACKNGIDSIIRSSRNAEIDKTYLLK